MFKKPLLAAVSLIALTALAAQAETIRIAEHRQARIDALKAVAPAIEAKLGVTIEVIEYPAPEKDYMSKLLTELGAGNAPDVFTVPGDSDVPDLATAGYVAPVTEAFAAWEGAAHTFDVAKSLATGADGVMYAVPTMLSVQQIYFRRDVLEKAGISTDQPKDWADLMARAKEIKDKTGQYALLFPMGASWGGGAFGEGFQYMLAGTDTPQLVAADGKLDLSSTGVKDVLSFYADLVNADLMPVDPLLGPEPWVIPKYEMFPAGQLVATTCGTWCYIYDWGPESKNPIPDVTKAVGTWEVPGKAGGNGHVMVSLNSPWLVNANASPLATQVALELGSVAADVAYASRLGNIPARRDAGDDAEFQKLTALVPVLKAVENGTYLQASAGFSAVSEGVARATEAILRKETDGAGAQKILVDYVTDVLGPDAVQ